LPLDIKGMGGYVAAPPSRRPSGRNAGRRYHISAGSWDDIGRLQPLRPGILPPACIGDGAEPVSLQAIAEGRRNMMLFRALLRTLATATRSTRCSRWRAPSTTPGW